MQWALPWLSHWLSRPITINKGHLHCLKLVGRWRERLNLNEPGVGSRFSPLKLNMGKRCRYLFVSSFLTSYDYVCVMATSEQAVAGEGVASPSCRRLMALWIHELSGPSIRKLLTLCSGQDSRITLCSFKKIL